MRIAFDLDGVLADMDSAVADEAERLFEDPPVPDEERTDDRLWRHLESIENFWEGLEEHEAGVVRRLADVAAERRWEVIFLTRRPQTAGRTAQAQTQRWLAAKGFPLPSVFVVQGSRGQIADALALDVVVDDRLENCVDVAVESKARAILVWRGPEDRIPASARRLGVGVVTSVGECLDILTRAAAEPAGILDRLMQLLGLKEPAATG